MLVSPVNTTFPAVISLHCRGVLVSSVNQNYPAILGVIGLDKPAPTLAAILGVIGQDKPAPTLAVFVLYSD